MNDPYKPPTAPVADPPLPAIKLARRPWPISVASIFIAVVILDSCLKVGRGNPLDMGFRLGWIGALVFLALMIERRRNWARWVLMGVAAWNALTLALMVFSPNLPEGVHLAMDYVAVARECAMVLCLLVATLLVFGPGRAWFVRVDG